MTISPEERTALRKKHVGRAWGECHGCTMIYPCPTVRLLDALDVAEQQAANLREMLTNTGWLEETVWLT